MIMTTQSAEQPVVVKATCFRHPDVTTRLHCNRCGHPICVKCAKLTDVGYKCPVCVQDLKARFFDGKWWDYLVASCIALPLSLLAASIFAFVIGSIGWFSWMIAFAGAPVASGFIAEAVRWGVGRRRSRYLACVAAGCLIVATVPLMLVLVIAAGLAGDILSGIYSLIEPGILVVAGIGTIMARLR
jgi:hypothetical protein